MKREDILRKAEYVEDMKHGEEAIYADDVKDFIDGLERTVNEIKDSLGEISEIGEL